MYHCLPADRRIGTLRDTIDSIVARWDGELREQDE
jgi:hypothetical protein